eukprot:COSAG02_NODE_12904_length_1474_cov_1.425455_1_plen_178_part_10
MYALEKSDFDDLLRDTVASAMIDLNERMARLKNTGQNLPHHQVSAQVEELLNDFDVDGDGQFSVSEVEAIVSSLILQKRRVKDMQYFAVAAFVSLLVVCFAMLGVNMLGNELSKDQDQMDNGLLTVHGTNKPVMVSSSDMVVTEDGSLVTRDGGRTVTTANINVTQTLPLSSLLPVEY